MEGDAVRVLPCNEGHRYHVACIDPWLRLKCVCPVCKADIRTTREGS